MKKINTSGSFDVQPGCCYVEPVPGGLQEEKQLSDINLLPPTTRSS